MNLNQFTQILQPSDNENAKKIPDKWYELYLQYDVKDKKIAGGYAEPAILQALARLDGKKLRIWQDVDPCVKNGGIKHVEEYNGLIEQNANELKKGQIDLLFCRTDRDVDKLNHYEKLTLHGCSDPLDENEIILCLGEVEKTVNPNTQQHEVTITQTTTAFPTFFGKRENDRNNQAPGITNAGGEKLSENTIHLEDTLARLFESHHECVAVYFDKNKVYVASNKIIDQSLRDDKKGLFSSKDRWSNALSETNKNFIILDSIGEKQDTVTSYQQEVEEVLGYIRQDTFSEEDDILFRLCKQAIQYRGKGKIDISTSTPKERFAKNPGKSKRDKLLREMKASFKNELFDVYPQNIDKAAESLLKNPEYVHLNKRQAKHFIKTEREKIIKSFEAKIDDRIKTESEEKAEKERINYTQIKDMIKFALNNPGKDPHIYSLLLKSMQAVGDSGTRKGALVQAYDQIRRVLHDLRRARRLLHEREKNSPQFQIEVVDYDRPGVHAECRLIGFLLEKKIIDLQETLSSQGSEEILGESDKDKENYIGISKLCCGTCEEVLLAIDASLGKEVISHDGYHGLLFELVLPKFLDEGIYPRLKKAFDERYRTVEERREHVRRQGMLATESSSSLGMYSEEDLKSAENAERVVQQENLTVHMFSKFKLEGKKLETSVNEIMDIFTSRDLTPDANIGNITYEGHIPRDDNEEDTDDKEGPSGSETPLGHKIKGLL